MSDLFITPAHNDARLAATAAYADTGSAASRVYLYASAPDAGNELAEPGTPPQVTVLLAKPCGAVSGHVLVLAQADVAGDLISTTGAALWGRWINGAGALVAAGTVTDESGTGAFRIAGTAGTMLYAGGRCRLTSIIP